MFCMRYMNIASTSSKMSLAAEFKRASPSKGDINVHVDIIEQVMMIDDDDIDYNANDDDVGGCGMIVIYDDCSNNKDDENEYHILFKIYDVFIILSLPYYFYFYYDQNAIYFYKRRLNMLRWVLV